MSRIITVKGLQIGAGIPKIVAPLTGNTHGEIIAQAQNLAGQRVDIAEWRADFFAGAGDTKSILYTLAGLRQVLRETPLLFTFRTKKEGGEKELPVAAYADLNQAVAESGLADLIDIEIFANGAATARQNIEQIHATRVAVMGSCHNFSATPPLEEIVNCLRQMQDTGADILKIALMPASVADVLTLLLATTCMNAQYAKRPIAAISMSKLGTISRLTGEAFGSALTFGVAGQASAPGQIPLEQLARALDAIHNAL